MRSSDPVRPDAKARIVRRLAAFCAPILLVWVLLEFWTAKAVPDSYALKRQNLEAQAEQVETLITGSSRAYQGISPRQLPGFAFNLAGPSQTLDYDYRLMMRVLPSLPKLRRVVMEIQDLSFFFQIHDGIEAWRQYYYQQEWGITPLKLQDWLDVRMFSRVALLTPQFYRQVLPAAVRSFIKGTRFVYVPSIPDIDDRGWWQVNGPKAPDLSTAGVAVTLARHASLMKAAYEPANLAYLTRMLSALRQRGIESVFVTLPVSPNYSIGMNKQYWAWTQAVTKKVAAEYGVRYFCFLNVPELGPQDFFDSDHLNRQGALRFTEMLRQAMERSSAPDDSFCACCSR
jgi:hypothetical protein